MSLQSLVLWIPRVGCVLFWTWIWGAIGFGIYVEHLNTPDLSEVTDAIVVFTGEEGRILKAYEIFRAQAEKPLLLVSGALFDKVNLIKSPRVYGDYAKNTEDNARIADRWIRDHGIRSVRLITSDYHMPRSLNHAKRWTARILPHPLHLSSPLRLCYLFKEYNKFLIAFCMT